MVLRLSWLVGLSFFIYSYSFADENLKISFEKQKIKIGSKIIHVEIAKTPDQHQYGLMNRNSLPENNGMLFIFENEQTLSFWMKNTFIDLSIAYIDKNKQIVDIQ